MRKLLVGAAIAVLCSFAAPAMASGPNCVSQNITTFNLAGNTAANPTTGSAVQQSFSVGSPTATIYTGADAKITTVTFQITGTWQGDLWFQGSSDEGTTFTTPLYATSLSGSQAPSGFLTQVPGSFLAYVTGLTAARVIALPSTLTSTFSGTAAVYTCAFSGAPGGFTTGAQPSQGSPFGFPQGVNVQWFNGKNVLFGPGLAAPGVPRVAVAENSNARVLLDDTKPTYRAAGSFTPFGTGDRTLISIKGSATKTIRVKRIFVSGVATANGSNLAILSRTTALGAGGTAVNPTVAKSDPGAAPGTAVVAHYTTAAQTLGTGPITLWEGRLYLGVTAVPTISQTPLPIFPESGQGGSALILRGVADFLEFGNVAGNITAGAVVDYVIEWVEDDS